jgi:hypothetical protein
MVPRDASGCIRELSREATTSGPLAKVAPEAVRANREVLRPLFEPVNVQSHTALSAIRMPHRPGRLAKRIRNVADSAMQPLHSDFSGRVLETAFTHSPIHPFTHSPISPDVRGPFGVLSRT